MEKDEYAMLANLLPGVLPRLSERAIRHPLLKIEYKSEAFLPFGRTRRGDTPTNRNKAMARLCRFPRRC